MSTEATNKPVRLVDLAQAAGVSKGTASNVFNRPDIVRDEVREHVLTIAKEIGYLGPDPKGRMLSAGKVNAIGVVTPEELAYFFTDPFGRELMSAIADACDTQGMGISLVSAANKESLVWNMRNAVVDGFILLCHDGNNKLIELSRERSLPVVALTANYEHQDIAFIDIDNIGAAQSAAEHLADLGHRHFAVLTLEFDTSETIGIPSPSRLENAVFKTGVKRLQGYLDGLKAYGIAPDSVPVYETFSTQESVDQALDSLFSQAQPPTALLAQSDRIALFALNWLSQHNIKVPEQVSIVGFDDVQESKTSQPPLTTISQPIVEMGHLAVSLLQTQKPTHSYKQLPSKLVIRESSAPPPQTI